MAKFTVWVMQDDREGTCHISSHEVTNEMEAGTLAIDETAADWGGWDKDALIVLGIAKGDVEIIEWNDDV